MSFASPETYFSRRSWGSREASYEGQNSLARLLSSGTYVCGERVEEYLITVDIYLVDVDGRVPLLVSQQVESSHTDLTKVTGMVFINVCTVVMLSRVGLATTFIALLILLSYLATSHTATTRVLSVLSYAALTGTDMATVLACF